MPAKPQDHSYSNQFTLKSTVNVQDGIWVTTCGLHLFHDNIGEEGVNCCTLHSTCTSVHLCAKLCAPNASLMPDTQVTSHGTEQTKASLVCGK